MNCFQPESLASFYVLYIVIDKKRTLGIDVISVEQDVIKLRERLAGFLNARNNNSFKPMEEIKIV